MITDIKKILVEWAYRTNDGKPNPKSMGHQILLDEVLKDFGWNLEQRSELMNNLMEQPSDREKLMKKVIKYKNDDGEDKEITVGGALKQGEEHPAYDKAKQITDTGDDKQQSKGLEPDDFERFSDKNKPDEKEKGDEQPKDDEEGEGIKSGEPNQKDKSLKDVNTSESEVYSNPDTGISDEEFSEKGIESNFENEEDELQESALDEYFASGKIPKKYQKVITRLMNSKLGKQSITDYMTGVGAGKIQSQAGEILTMASVGMNDEEFDGFMETLNKQVGKYPKGSKPVVTKDWLESVKHVRTVTMKRYNSEFGKGNWSISNSAWDVQNEFEALGNDDYNANKGFSSDMYVKLEVNGEPVLDEISLKKDSTANIYNGVVTDINNWSDKVPPQADIKEYKKGEIQRPIEYGTKAKTLKYTSDDLLNENVIKNKNLKITLASLGVIKGDAKKGYTIDSKAQEILDELSSMEIPPPIDRARFKEVMGTGDTTRFKKYMIMHAAVQRANEIANGNDGESEASKFLNNHLGYEKGEDGKFPKGSIKRYENDTIQFLVEDEEAKEGCLNALAEKLPMKSLLEGEEKMAIGGLSADPKTLKRMFGIDNYDDFKAGLTMKDDDLGQNYLVYRSQKPAKEVSIAEVQVRQKGKGYASSVGLEFAIATDLAKELYDANKEEYPPEPEISSKERNKLGVG